MTKYVSAPLLAVLTLVLVCTHARLFVDVLPSGDYTVLLDGEPVIFSAPSYLSGAQLKVARVSSVNGSDALGRYLGTKIHYEVTSFHSIIKSYPQDVSALVFTQVFPDGVRQHSGAGGSMLSVFPSLAAHSHVFTSDHFNYFGFSRIFAISSIQKASMLLSEKFVPENSRIPVTFYDVTKRSNYLTISPLDHFQVAAQGSLDGRSWGCGLLSDVQYVPAGFQYSTLLRAGHGMNDTMMAFGDTVRLWNNAPAKRADATLDYLSYYTDNGAFYYYNTVPGKNYQDTLLEVVADLRSRQFPIHYVQLDSWWYPKARGNPSDPVPNGGLLEWVAMRDVFPQGMIDVIKQMDLPLGPVLHSRFFAFDNYYWMVDNYEFLMGSTMGLPLHSDVYDVMMKQNTGMSVYEQDWLGTVWTNFSDVRSNISLGITWFENMDRAAAANDLTIQLCMALPSQLLQSVSHSTMTHARCTDDFHPGESDKWSQWALAYTSMLAHAVGLVPHKDDFWTSSEEQHGCIWTGRCRALNPELETLVACLTTGPVGFSDKIGMYNRSRVMQVCREDGLLLKADSPALPLDLAFELEPASFTAPTEFQHLIQLTSSFTSFGNNRWSFLLAANLSQAVKLLPSDLGLSGEHYYFDYFNSHDSGVFFDELMLDTGATTTEGVVPFSYFTVSPKFPKSGLVLIGEVGKYIRVSKKRISSIFDEPDHLLFFVTGAVGEIVHFQLLVPPKYHMISVMCQIAMGPSRFECVGSRCECLHSP